MLREWLRRFRKPKAPPPMVVTVITPDGRERVRGIGEPFLVNGDVSVTVLAVSGDGIMLSVSAPRHAPIYTETAGGVPLPSR